MHQIKNLETKLESSMWVGQSGVKSSVDGTPLYSIGFSKCSALIVRSLVTGESQL